MRWKKSLWLEISPRCCAMSQPSANDLVFRGSVACPTLHIDGMTIAERNPWPAWRCSRFPSIRPMRRPRSRSCRRVRQYLRSTALRPKTSPTSAAHPTFAGGWSGCCSLLPSIRGGCSSRGGCGALRGGSPAPNLNRCSRSFLFWKNSTAKRPWSACICARPRSFATSAAILIRALW